MNRFSSEKLCGYHPDINANSMAIDNKSSILALGAKNAIFLLNIDNPTNVVRKLSRYSKSDAIASEFHPNRKLYYALSSNQNAEIYSFDHFKNASLTYNFHSFNGSNYRNNLDNCDEFDDSDNENKNSLVVLKGHTRPITDLNWSTFNFNLLATSSIDTFVHIWDMRDTQKPHLSLSSVAGTSQVKWNKIDENLIATAHEVDVRIWDIRKGNFPLNYIAAHVQKIYGLDWNPNSGTQLASCSQDNTVKFWDLNFLKNKAESIITNNLPVWKAKYTPVGNGLITVVVGHLRQARDNSLWLWNSNCLDKPVYSFVGPQNVVIDFNFRINETDSYSKTDNLDYSNLMEKYKEIEEDLKRFDLEFYDTQDNLNSTSSTKINKKKLNTTIEIVTWSKDSKLRVWDLNENVLNLVNCDLKELVKFNNRYLLSQHYNKMLGNGFSKNKLNCKLKEDFAIENQDIKFKTKIHPSQNIIFNYSEGYSNSNSNLKELGDSIQKRMRKASMTISPTSVSPADLKQEFELIDLNNLKNLDVEETNPMKRYYVVRAKSSFNNFAYRLKIIFPLSYPNDIPKFIFLDANTKPFEKPFTKNDPKQKSCDKLQEEFKSNNLWFDFNNAKLTQRDLKFYQETKNDLIRILQNTAYMQVKRNRPCLEQCLKDFVATLDRKSNIINSLLTTSNNINSNLNIDTFYGSFHDGNIPFPKTCGAKFCGPNLLVCFSRHNFDLSNSNNLSGSKNQNDLNKSTPTPKALSDLSFYLNTNKKLSQTNNSSSSNSLNRQSEIVPKLNLFPISVPKFYPSNKTSTGKLRHKSKSKQIRNTGWKCLPICIYDIEKILPCNKYLAENYIFDKDPMKMCTFNANVAAKIGKKDHYSTWSVCKLICDPLLKQSEKNDCNLIDSPWAQHPFSRKLIDALIDYYLSILDIQMTAMLVCCFASFCNFCNRFACLGKNCQKSLILNEQEKKLKSSNQTNKNTTYSIIGTINEHKNKSIFDKLTFSNSNVLNNKDIKTQLKSYDIIRRNRSNSWSDIAESNDSLSDLTVVDSFCSMNDSMNSLYNLKANQNDYCFTCHNSDLKLSNKINNEDVFKVNDCHCCFNENSESNSLRKTDQFKQLKFDFIKQIYADLLFRWRLFEQRCKLLNHVKIDYNFQKKFYTGIDFCCMCSNCNYKIQNRPQCKKCRKIILKCSICHLSVKGLTNACLMCGHGGHAFHINNWFEENEECPTGCGCFCKLTNYEDIFA